MIVIPTLFRKLQTVKELVRLLSKKHRFRTPFDNQLVKEFQPVEKSAWDHFHLAFSSLWENLIWRRSALAICYVLGLLGNILTANDKYPLQDYENLLTLVQMQPSWKLKIFSDLFVLFLETTLNLENFEIKDDPHTYLISEITDCQRLG